MILYLPSVWPLNSNAIVCEEGEVFWGVYAFVAGSRVRGSGLGARGSGLVILIPDRRAALAAAASAHGVSPQSHRAERQRRAGTAALHDPAHLLSSHLRARQSTSLCDGIGRDTSSRSVMAPTAIDGSTSMNGGWKRARDGASPRSVRTSPIAGSLAAPHCLADASAIRRHRSGPRIVDGRLDGRPRREHRLNRGDTPTIVQSRTTSSIGSPLSTA